MQAETQHFLIVDYIELVNIIIRIFNDSQIHIVLEQVVLSDDEDPTITLENRIKEVRRYMDRCERTASPWIFPDNKTDYAVYSMCPHLISILKNLKKGRIRKIGCDAYCIAEIMNKTYDSDYGKLRISEFEKSIKIAKQNLQLKLQSVYGQDIACY